MLSSLPQHIALTLLLFTHTTWLPAGDTALPVLDVPYATTKPSLEAKADDPAWKRAAVVPKLSLSLGTDKGSVAKPTEVRLLWDERFLYLRFTCEDDAIHLPETGRDAPLYRGDVVQVFIDAKGDSRQVIEVLCNANNDVQDLQILLTTEPRSDENLQLRSDVEERDYWICQDWNASGLRTAAAKDEKAGRRTGWRVEMAIPAKALLRRLGERALRPMTLRANLVRYEWQPPPGPNQEWSLLSMNWAPVMEGCPHLSPAAMGFLKLRPKLPDAKAQE